MINNSRRKKAEVVSSPSLKLNNSKIINKHKKETNSAKHPRQSVLKSPSLNPLVHKALIINLNLNTSNKKILYPLLVKPNNTLTHRMSSL